MNNWPIPAFGTISKLIPSFAYAIAKAEGFFIKGSVPARINNPGDLKLGDIGFGALLNGITIYPSFAQGVEALYNELNLILTNTSSEYNTSMNFAQMAFIWSGNDNPVGWSDTVAKSLNVFVDTTIQSWMDNHV
jgi:hypothetical protein